MTSVCHHLCLSQIDLASSLNSVFEISLEMMVQAWAGNFNKNISYFNKKVIGDFRKTVLSLECANLGA